MKRKNIRLLPPIALDERQRQQMYQIEHRGFWFAYFGILALLLLEILTNASGILIGCTTILLLALSIYMECCCIRRGLWDWRLKPNPKSNALMSMIGAVCIFVLQSSTKVVSAPRPFSSSISIFLSFSSSASASFS